MLANSMETPPAAGLITGVNGILGLSPGYMVELCAVQPKFPEPSNWLSFDALVSKHTMDMSKNDTSAEIADVVTAVHSVADISGGALDPYVLSAPKRPSKGLREPKWLIMGEYLVV